MARLPIAPPVTRFPALAQTAPPVLQRKSSGIAPPRFAPFRGAAAPPASSIVQAASRPAKTPIAPTPPRIPGSASVSAPTPPSPSPSFEVDADSIRAHVLENHTRVGIRKARKVKSAGFRVGIFPDEKAVDKALRAAPSAATAWKPRGGGRYDADVDGVHYQATMLGSKMSLNSCYPVGPGSSVLKTELEAEIGADVPRSSRPWFRDTPGTTAPAPTTPQPPDAGGTESKASPSTPEALPPTDSLSWRDRGRPAPGSSGSSNRPTTGHGGGSRSGWPRTGYSRSGWTPGRPF